MSTKDGIEKYLVIPRENISRLSFIIQGYEGFATVTTIDKTRAVVKLFIMKDFADETEELMENLKKEMILKDKGL